MKKIIASFTALSLVFPAPAFAKEHRQVLPDGSVRVTNFEKQGNLLAPSATAVTVDLCRKDSAGVMVCVNERAEIVNGRSVAETLLAPLTYAAGGIASAAALRPTRINESTSTNVSNDSSSTASPNVSATASPVTSSGSYAENYSPASLDNYNPVSTSLDNYAPTSVATGHGQIDSNNKYSSDNTNSNNTIDSFDPSNSYNPTDSYNTSSTYLSPPAPPPPPPTGGKG